MNLKFYYIIGLIVATIFCLFLLCNNSKMEKIEVIGDEQLFEMEIVDNTFEEKIFKAENYEEMSIEERKALAEVSLDYLCELSYIDEKTILYDENSATYTFMYKSGVLGTLVLKNWSPDYDEIIIK